MELIATRQMISQDWNTFERYPEQGSDIMLHVKGYKVRENKYYHDFVRITSFDGKKFHPARYIKNMQGVAWSYTWLPVFKLKAD